MSPETKIYDIYGFIIAVEGPAINYFQKEFGRLESSRGEVKDIDLYVKPTDKEGLPTRSAGSLKGLYIPFAESENILWYNPRESFYVLLSYCEALARWDDKAFLHASCVSKNSQALLFMGSGNVGKTSIVMNLLNKGYEYLSDDWLIIGNGKAYPFPKTIHIFDYNLNNKQVAKKVLGSKRIFYSILLKLLRFGEKSAPHRYVRFAFQSLTPRFDIDIQTLHPDARIGKISSVSKVFYLERWARDDIEVEDKLNVEQIARRMAYVNLYERNYFFKEYARYVYEYNVRNYQIENQSRHDFEVIYNTLKDAPLVRVLIPKKADFTTGDISFLQIR